jgi:hypothetical protein
MGPFCVIVKREGVWWKVTALFQSRNGRHIARSCAGRSRQRSDALLSVRAVIR